MTPSGVLRRTRPSRSSLAGSLAISSSDLRGRWELWVEVRAGRGFPREKMGLERPAPLRGTSALDEAVDGVARRSETPLPLAFVELLGPNVGFDGDGLLFELGNLDLDPVSAGGMALRRAAPRALPKGDADESPALARAKHTRTCDLVMELLREGSAKERHGVLEHAEGAITNRAMIDAWNTKSVPNVE